MKQEKYNYLLCFSLVLKGKDNQIAFSCESIRAQGDEKFTNENFEILSKNFEESSIKALSEYYDENFKLKIVESQLVSFSLIGTSVSEVEEKTENKGEA